MPALLTSNDVVNDVKFIEYCQQRLGTPWPTLTDVKLLAKYRKEVFDQYPTFDWRSMVRLVEWAKAKNRRHPRVWMIVADFRRAWSDGYLPELDRDDSIADQETEREIRDALQVERDEFWRSKLIGARGAIIRREVLEAWKTSREEAKPTWSQQTLVDA